MERQPSIVVFVLVQIILYDVVVCIPRPSLSSARLSRVGRSVQRQNYQSLPPSPYQPDAFSLLTDRRGNYGRYNRPLFGTLSQRSSDQIPADPDQYWDFVLGSGTFKRRSDFLRPLEANSGRDRLRRDVSSAEARRPIFDVLGRRVTGDDDSANEVTSRTAADSVGSSETSAESLKKKSDQKSVRSFFPSTPDENQDFFDFLLGEQRR